MPGLRPVRILVVVSALAVACEVQTFSFLISADPDADKLVCDIVADEGDNSGPADGYDYGNQLSGELGDDGVIAFLEAGSAKLRSAEDTGKERADDTADTVNSEYIEGIINLEELLEAVNTPEADEAGCETDYDGTAESYEAAGRGDGNQAGNCTGACTEAGGLAVHNPLAGTPCDNCAGRCNAGGHECEGSGSVRGKLRACVESEPAHPEECGADHAERKAVRSHSFLAVADSGLDIVCTYESAHSCVDMDDRAACEVPYMERAVKPAAAPDHVPGRYIGEGEPDYQHDEEAAELDSSGEGAEDQSCGDGGECALEAEVGKLRKAAVENGVRSYA